MILIREFEERIEDLYSEGQIAGSFHLCCGQEACAVGACAAIRPDDYAVSNHRGHGHFIAKGGDPKLILAELYGRVTGYSRGRGGSQHMACFKIGFLGSNGITGGGIPIAAGAALAIKLHHRSQVVLCFLGDGASNQGTFHETLNMAALWKLPIVFICENNLYAMSTPIQQSTLVTDIADRSAAYGMPGGIVDGNDVLAVSQAVGLAAERARTGLGPTLVECKTYRYHGHSKSDAREYRTRQEEAEWRDKDPINLFAQELRRRGILNDLDDKAVRSRVTTTIEEAIRFAKESPFPDPKELENALFA